MIFNAQYFFLPMLIRLIFLQLLGLTFFHNALASTIFSARLSRYTNSYRPSLSAFA